MPDKKKRIEIRLKDGEFKKVEDLARIRGRPIAQIVREAVDTLYEKVSAQERKKAVEDLAALSVKLPSWEKIEEEIEGLHED